MPLPRTDLAPLVTEAHLAVPDLTLSELADLANREHRLVEESAASALEHAIRAGGALLAAYVQVPSGTRIRWMENNFSGSRTVASIYMRLARYSEQIPADVRSVRAARESLRWLPDITPRGHPPLRLAVTPEELHDAKERLDNGDPLALVARDLGVSDTTLRYHVIPGEKEREKQRARERHRRKRLAEKALLRQERDQAVKQVGGDPARAYEHVRKAAQAVQAALDAAPDRDAKSRWSDALNILYTAEDAIAAALRLK